MGWGEGKKKRLENENEDYYNRALATKRGKSTCVAGSGDGETVNPLRTGPTYWGETYLELVWGDFLVLNGLRRLWANEMPSVLGTKTTLSRHFFYPFSTAIPFGGHIYHLELVWYVCFCELRRLFFGSFGFTCHRNPRQVYVGVGKELVSSGRQ